MDRKKLYQACVLILNQHKKFAMAMFNSKLFVYQRVVMGKSWDQVLKMDHFWDFYSWISNGTNPPFRFRPGISLQHLQFPNVCDIQHLQLINVDNI